MSATLTIQLFGQQAQLAGRREVRLEPAPASLAEVRAALARACPALAPTLASSRFAVNQAYAIDTDAVRPGDEVALIGLVGGG